MRTDARRRPAAVALAALIACTGLFVLFGLFIWVGVVRAAKTEARRAADAASLAAAVKLADNRILIGDLTVLTDADSAARTTAAPNLIYGRPPTLAPFVNNAPTGDVVFGSVDPTKPIGQRFTAGANPLTSATLPAVNAVKVRARGIVGGCPNDDGSVCGGRPIGPFAVAWFDTSVYGYRPVNLPNPPTTNDPRTPVVPIALFQELTPDAVSPFSWSELGTVPAGGPVPALNVVLGTPATLDDPAVQGVSLAVFDAGAPFADFVTQLNTGLRTADLTAAAYGGRFVLAGSPLMKAVPATVVPPTTTLADYAPLTAAGRTVVFPLYTAIAADTGSPTGATATLTGFVSARVTAVGLSPSGLVQLTVVPTRFQSPSALTDPAGYNLPAAGFQPLAGRVRIAE